MQIQIRNKGQYTISQDLLVIIGRGIKSITQQVFLTMFIRNTCCVIDLISLPVIYTHNRDGTFQNLLVTLTRNHILQVASMMTRPSQRTSNMPGQTNVI